LVDVVAIPFVLAQSIEWQTAYYAVATLAAALILAALLELRLVHLEKKLDKLLDAKPKSSESPSNHTSPQEPSGTPPTPTALPEADLLKIIHAVDESFEGSKRARISVLISIVGIASAGVLAVALAIFFSRLAATAVLVPGLLDTGLNILALAVATGALGLSLLTTAMTYDWEKQRRRVEQRNHYGKLKVCGMDPVRLRALIIMRSVLPKGITLQQIYDRNSGLFTDENLASKVLEV